MSHGWHQMHTKSLFLSRLLDRRYLLGNLLLNAQPIVVIGKVVVRTNFMIDIGPQLCSDLSLHQRIVLDLIQMLLPTQKGHTTLQ
jgi:hypothetical protein